MNPDTKSVGPISDSGQPQEVTSAILPTKTPMYQATHAPRYQRQDLIRKIQATTGRRLICYVCGSSAQINRDDTLGVVDVLHNLPKNVDVDFLVHTGGGDMDAAEKLISMIRDKVGTGSLRVIVPDYAKSAGTLMAIGADRIIMSDSSELGPIDPQITLNDGHGNYIPHSVQSYLDAYDAHTMELAENPENVAAKIMLAKLDPATVKLFRIAKQRSKIIAENLLKRGMLKQVSQEGKSYTLVASGLIDTNKWLSHGQMIGHQDASDIGLEVDYLDPSCPEWTSFWQLYTLQRMAILDRHKLFESEHAFFTYESSV